MRIGIDIRKINDTGIGRYIASLVENLLRVDDKNEYVLFLDPKDADKFDDLKTRVTKIIEPSGKYSIAEHFSLPSKANRLGLDIFHAPHYVLPFFMKVPSVVTVHDVIHLLDPAFGLPAREYARFMIRSAVTRARRVITVSDYTKRNLIGLFNATSEKIRVIPNGGGDGFAHSSDDAIKKTADKYGITPGYYLFVGSDRPHKNLKAVAEALRLMGDDSFFVVAGRVSDDSKKLFAGVEGRVRFIGQNIEKGEMAALYSGASALLFPSFHEGFGLPPLEAMACGTPVVASNASCMPEILGDSAVMADPLDYRSMAEGLAKLKNDPAYRADYIAKGRERVRAYSWEKVARMTLEVYEACV
ncbi:MAG: glycosyltransferase family 4 protein [Nitrospinae bacterium]|nr:glycosyltransferase family 4 protein [Nitrospinota bacterium]